MIETVTITGESFLLTAFELPTDKHPVAKVFFTDEGPGDGSALDKLAAAVANLHAHCGPGVRINILTLPTPRLTN